MGSGIIFGIRGQREKIKSSAWASKEVTSLFNQKMHTSLCHGLETHHHCAHAVSHGRVYGPVHDEVCRGRVSPVPRRGAGPCQKNSGHRHQHEQDRSHREGLSLPVAMHLQATKSAIALPCLPVDGLPIPRRTGSGSAKPRL